MSSPMRLARRAIIALIVASGISSLAATLAFAQSGGPSGIDHYLVYRVNPTVLGPFSVILRDQFSPQQTTHVATPMEFFANPVSKNGEGIVDTLLHYSWWRITPQPFSATVIASNQFGDQVLQVSDAEYLLNTALKNPHTASDRPPLANHYECYRATGSFVPRTVTLQDQFGTFQGTVFAPEWFCNGVEKVYLGLTDPIVRPDAHLVCYRVQVAPVISPITILFLDQFRIAQTTLSEPTWLCVPTIKQQVVPTSQSTWGEVKAIYR